MVVLLDIIDYTVFYLKGIVSELGTRSIVWVQLSRILPKDGDKSSIFFKIREAVMKQGDVQCSKSQ
jgi:hypothetical protein